MLRGGERVISEFLFKACERGEIRRLDYHVGMFVARLAGGDSSPGLLLAATLASAATSWGHVCLPLAEVAGLPVQIEPEYIPEVEIWRKELLATSVVSEPGGTAPLILDEKNRLYLFRYHSYEEQIFRAVMARAERQLDCDLDDAARLLDCLFPGNKEADAQVAAAAMALLRGLLVISGGPGTGKTYTIARVLALVQALAGNPLRIGLAAPTGKAAARLEESIAGALKSIPPDLGRNVPTTASTLHRLLGYHPQSGEFSRNGKRPLALDLLVVDEASMVDVVMMSALLDALEPETRLILLGDRYQLASVEAGNLFGDLCGPDEQGWSGQLCATLATLTGGTCNKTNQSVPVMADTVVTLNKSYRFADSPGISSLASAVNSGAVQRVTEVLKKTFKDLEIVALQGGRRQLWLAEQIVQGFSPIFRADSVQEAFEAMEFFRVLCAVIKGPSGVETVNQLAERRFHPSSTTDREKGWYAGKPIIIRRNQYDLQLFNGDTGILWPDETGTLQAWFKQPDNSLRAISPARLPEHDAAYAITIHKAQGSEFSEVLLVLPEEENRALSRELVYTGISRARNRLTLCCSKDILILAVKRQTRRFSGLAGKIRMPEK